jgi:hypothetical protein
MLRPAVSSSWLRNLNQENPMTVIHYIGFDVHKKTISYCVKAADGRIVQEGKLAATRPVILPEIAASAQRYRILVSTRYCVSRGEASSFVASCQKLANRKTTGLRPMRCLSFHT